VSRIGAIDVDRLRDWLDTQGFSGAVHASGADDEPVIELAAGLADRAGAIPNRVDTTFAVASVSKLVTGMTVARLVERGVLRWDARYVDLVPDSFRPPALDARITLHHLLTHTSGFANYFDEDEDGGFEAVWRATPSTAIRGPRDAFPLLAGLPQLTEPGTTAAYNDGGFILVGIALEELSGRPFPEIVAAEVFEPLGMMHSGFWALDEVVPGMADGYLPPVDAAAAGSADSRWRTNVYAVPAMGGPDGGVQSTVRDLARLLDGLIGWRDARSFVSPAVRAQLVGPHARGQGDDAIFAFGCGVLHVTTDEPSGRVGHTGEDPGASARVWGYPATGERVVVASNVSSGAGPLSWYLHDALADTTPAA